MESHQPHNPLHGITLQAMLSELVDQLGWDDLGARIKIRCFTNGPSIGSSLAFLRKTPWARAKVERLFLEKRAERAFKKMGKKKAK